MEILRQNGFNIVHLTDGKLISDAIKLIINGQADGVNFNFVKNFPTDISEIKLAPQTKYIQINDYSGEFDYSAIAFLSNLEDLSIYANDKKTINYLNYPNLIRTALFWRPKASSLFQCESLESLFIGKYTNPDLSEFKGLKKLKYLRINTGSVKTLKGVENLWNLETLLLMQMTRLEDLDGIEKLTNLKYLRIDNCRLIKNIDIVLSLKGINILEIVGSTPKLTQQDDGH